MLHRLMDRSKALVCSKGFQHHATRTFLIALLLFASASALSAETLLMPPRSGLMGQSLVVWGISTKANGTAYTIDFGDNSPLQSGSVADRSYIAFNHTYQSLATFTATLTVDGESATVQIAIFDPSGLTADNLRNEKINMAIEDGLRWLWTSQSQRTNFDTSPQTGWTNRSFTALGVLAFQNQGYQVPNNDTTPTGLYQKYVVQRGLNYIVNQLQAVTLTVKGSGDPCAGFGPAPCTGLKQSFESEGYATSIAIMALAGTGAPQRHITDTTGNSNGNLTAGKTLGEILQRTIDALAFGQNDTNQPDNARGGWWYSFNTSATDGSTIGWNMVALLDASAAGATIPAFVKPEFANHTFKHGLESAGFFDYQAGTTPLPSAMRAGVALQTEFFAGDNTLSGASQTFISNRWESQVFPGDYTGTCGGTQNKGCAYAMFNIFKGLKLQGVTTLPGVSRPAGPGSQPAHDWYADYQDWLTNQGAYTGQQNQVQANTTTGGFWNMGFSCCASDTAAVSALAELIMSPVALVLPDPVKFLTLGLQQTTDNAFVAGTHTVTGHTESTNGTPVPGATITFKVLSGPNTGTIGTATTDSSGNAPISYTDTGGVGVDTLQGFLGNLVSNKLTFTWNPDPIAPACTLTAVLDGPPIQIQVTVQDAESGLATVVVTEATNASVSVPPFTAGTTSPVVVTATKIDETQGSRVGFQVTDRAGNVTICDPAVVSIDRQKGAPATVNLTGIPQKEGKVMIANGTPGVTTLSLTVNGQQFQVGGLKDGERRDVNVSSAMKPGTGNVISVRAEGKPGGSATILVHN